MAGTIGLERVGAVATVVIDQPQRRNAFNRAMWRKLAEIFTRIDADPALRCVILRGQGDAAFSAGADISEFAEARGSAQASRGYEALVTPAMRAVASCRLPVIAEIHGVCVGGGLEIAICADLRVCGESSKFAIPSARLGLVLGYDELFRAAQLIGPANLKEILFTGATLDAARALAMGLVDHVVAESEVGARVADLVERIIAGAPLSHRFHKQALAELARVGHPDGVAAASHARAHDIFDSADFREGYQAFMEKRRPAFRGK